MTVMSVPDAVLAARAAQQSEIVRKHQERAAQLRDRRTHEHRLHVFAAATTVVLLAALLASGFYAGFISVSSVVPAAGNAAPGSFAATKTGKLLIPTDAGWCKTLNFDNTTGLFSNTQMVDCEEFNNKAAAAPKAERGNYDSFKDAFHRR